MKRGNLLAGASLSVGLLAAGPVAAQTVQSAPSQETTAAAQTAPEDDAGSQIVVIGSRVANRTVADSPVPIDVISESALQASGTGELNKTLNQLVPSFNFPQPSIADGSDVTRPATLRGLNPDQTLVLLNGKRRHVSALLNINGTVGRGAAAVDMNMIPALAIKQIEVLRDGASSQYGSDAIAGVINVQLKTADSGGRAQVSYGKYVTTLDGVSNFDGLVGGQPALDTTDSRYLQGASSGERKARDGIYTTFGVNVGLPVGDGGFFNFTGEYRDRNFTNRQGYDLRPNYVRPTSTTFDPREASFNRLDFRYGDAKTEDFNFLINAGLPLGAADFYAFATYGHRDGLSAANFRQQSAATNRDFSVLTPATTPTNGNFVGLTPDGYLPKIQSNIDDMSATSGIRADLAGFKGDFSVGFGRNELNYRTEDSVNVSFGPQSQRSFDAGGLTFSQILANADLSRQFDAGLAGPLSFAFGGEYRHEIYQIRPGDPQSYQTGPFFQASRATTSTNCTVLGGVYTGATGICSFPGRAAAAGAQGFGGLPASARTNVNRDSFAGYVEFDADLFTGLTATAAGRYEHYSDFGDTVNGKLALRYEFIPGVAIRGSVSNGFRAPSLHQQYFTTTSTNFLAGVPVDVSTVPVSSPVARALGSQPLDPEKSLNLSGGATLNPFRGFNVTVDYFRIKITDRIVLSENLGAAGVGTPAQNAAVQAVLAANGFSTVGAARFFINGLDTTTQGVDAVATYRANLPGIGAWNFSAAYNYTQNQIDKRLNNLGSLAQIPGLVLFGRVEGIRFERGQPRTKVVLATDGKIAGVGVSARTTRYGSVISPETTAPLGTNATSLTALGPDDQVLRPKWITDFSLSYELRGVQLTLGVDNAFDVYPDRRPFGLRPASVGGSYPATYQFLPYSGFSPFGFNGRFLYARAAVNF
ncbi:TonB-dependent receptor [Sphingomonas sp. A2-49]|uniref:TonB-dependent receptor plug domain-containing protein n=1 Tax=Sphingomonas sp. A2-49 TaxID=1391375 RepID=UPI0021CE9507|nr:TonB-dependent receptor [Sphingomonas sp. A2-49]MCU6455500.1 TonB-dependent receptor [Sphingomonas sp. A2-49]